MLGDILIYLSLGFSILTIVSYSLFGKKSSLWTIISSSMYFAMSAAIVATSVYLLSNILSHNFSFTYIWQYSSRELQDGYLIASFYSGQQGSFLLWALLLSLIGLLIVPYSRKHGYERVVMPLFTLIILFILLMLVFKSPFEYVWQTYADQDLNVGFMPQNGRGLNPILQNYWITIHPPILFTGYSALAVPFVFALAGVILGDYKRWIIRALPWSLFATAVLGFGIMLGGFWAYETLGWGGFWGWDPVENSSLVPWLISVVFIHTMLIQRKTGGMVKTNIVLATLSFVFVLYATFLTRSGVLGDSSVHSFVEPGRTIYVLLVLFMGIFVLGAASVLIWKWKSISRNTPKRELKPKSKEFSILLGSIFLLALTLIILLGTSWPAIADLFGQEKASVDISFYNQWGIVFFILILILNAISLYQQWAGKSFKQIIHKIVVSFGFAVVATAIMTYSGVQEFKYMLLSLTAFFALFANLDFIITKIAKSPKSLGAYVSHFGVAILILGAIVSGAYSVSQTVMLEKGETKEVLGYNMTFTGRNQIETHLFDREKYEFHIKIEKNGSESVVSPILYWSDYNNREAVFLEPGIDEKLFKDIYVSPVSIESESQMESFQIAVGETLNFPGDENINVTLIGFDRSKVVADANATEVMIGSIVEFILPDESKQTDTLYAWLRLENALTNPIPIDIEGLPWAMGLNNMMMNEERTDIAYAELIYKPSNEEWPEYKEFFTFEASIKPLINLVWVGTILLVGGFFMSMPKYRNTLKMIRQVEENERKNLYSKSKESKIEPSNEIESPVNDNRENSDKSYNTDSI